MFTNIVTLREQYGGNVYNRICLPYFALIVLREVRFRCVQTAAFMLFLLNKCTTTNGCSFRKPGIDSTSTKSLKFAVHFSFAQRIVAIFKIQDFFGIFVSRYFWSAGFSFSEFCPGTLSTIIPLIYFIFHRRSAFVLFSFHFAITRLPNDFKWTYSAWMSFCHICYVPNEWTTFYRRFFNHGHFFFKIFNITISNYWASRIRIRLYTIS